MFGWLLRLVAFGAIASVAGYAALASKSTDGAGEIPVTLEGDPNRGAYVARMAGCIACHSDFENGGKPLAGGPALKTDFGTFVAPNITPDKELGIGAWSLSDFAVALRHGVSPDGEPYYPAFPYPFYTRLTDQDIVDLWAAIWTVPPVARSAPEHDLTFPFSIREGLKVWRAMYFEPGRFEPDPNRDESWNRGAYIVQGPGHCGACHTPRNLFGAREPSLRCMVPPDFPTAANRLRSPGRRCGRTDGAGRISRGRCAPG